MGLIEISLKNLGIKIEGTNVIASQFWCECCDVETVTEGTGRLFQVTGTVYDRRTNRILDEEKTVLLPLCNRCLIDKGLSPKT